MKDFDLQKNEFVKYWDEVVDIWLNKKEASDSIKIDADRPIDEQEESFYKDKNLNVCIESDQQWWFNVKKLNEILCPIQMPEPYWGNPDSCSIVIVNYNPAGGAGMNQHTYRGEGESYSKNTMIEYVNHKSSYSELALDFPILSSAEKLANDERFWLRSYEGRKWWRGKIEWMTHLVQPSSTPSIEWPENVERPFAIELCGWHSTNWKPDNTRAIAEKKELINSVRIHFLIPLLKAIEASKCQMAVCIGEQFSVLQKYYHCDETKFLDMTSSEQIKELISAVSEKWNDGNVNISLRCLSQVEIDNNPNISGEASKSIAVMVEKNWKDKKGKEKKDSVTRYYRVYNIISEGRSHIILNTFAPGGNRHPAREFWPFEKLLIEKINELWILKKTGNNTLK